MNLLKKPLFGFLALSLFALIPSCGSNANKLPALQADLSQTSVSGFSAGGYMAGQFLVAYSGSVIGAGIVAAGPYGCAQSIGEGSTIFFPATLAYNLARAENGCMSDRLSGLGVLNSNTLLRRAGILVDEGKIDPLSSLHGGRIYLYSGTDDRTVVKPVVEAARDFFLAAGVSPANIDFVTMPGGHAFLTAGKGEACNKSEPPYVNNCDYDQAGAILSFIYRRLQPKDSAKTENFVTFNQAAYAAEGAKLADEGVLYVPSACRSQAGCRVHIVFHGCRQSRADVGDAVTRESGFAEWAEANKIVVLFPQVAASTLNPQKCWDWWGYTGLNFLAREAPQIKSVKAMLARLGEIPAT